MSVSGVRNVIFFENFVYLLFEVFVGDAKYNNCFIKKKFICIPQGKMYMEYKNSKERYGSLTHVDQSDFVWFFT